MSVKEPEAKTLLVLYREAAQVVEKGVSFKEAFKHFQETLKNSKFVSESEAKAFAEARVKQLKQEIRSRIRPFRDAFNDGMFDDLDHDTLDNFNEQLKMLEKFLEEAKQP